MCAVALVAIPRSIFAQDASNVADKFAVISGTVVDSIRGGYLVGAVVRVNGTSRAAMTDTLGRFRIDSVSAGSHQLEVIHPLLDTLGMTLKTPPMSFHAGANTSIRLSIPAGLTVVTAKCSAADRKVGEAALIGMVLEADGDAPAVGANVSLEWVDLIPADKGFRKVFQKRAASVRSDGSFRICGLPADLSTNAIATRGTDSTSIVGVRPSPFLALVTFFLPAGAKTTAPGASEARRSGVLMGRILGADGVPMAHVRVAVDGDDTVAVSGNDGKFVLGRLRPGTRTVTVRALGYQPVERVVAISSLEPRFLDVKLDKVVPVLKSVEVSAVRDIGLERVGFTQRQREQPTGRFFTPEYIERRNPQNLVMLLETALELRRRRTWDGKEYIRASVGCLRYFIDGARLAPAVEDDVLSAPDSYLNAAEIGAVEIYNRDNVPGEYASSDRTAAPCTVVLIWTKFRLGI